MRIEPTQISIDEIEEKDAKEVIFYKVLAIRTESCRIYWARENWELLLVLAAMPGNRD